MEFKEFPKCLYTEGRADGGTRIAMDADEQKAAAEEGFLPLGAAKAEDADQAKPPTKRRAKAEDADQV